MYLYGAHVVKGTDTEISLTPSFSEYLAFTKVRIMSATKEMDVTGGVSLDEY